jgi:MarR family transcriptional regulator, organic hydroperoxide resistance regulator
MRQTGCRGSTNSSALRSIRPLYEEADHTVGQLGEKLFLDSCTLTPLLKRLEAMGVVTRQRDPQDERQVRINLTAQGRALRERGRAVRVSMQRATGLAPQEQRRLREAMVRLRGNLTAAEDERRS